MKNLQVVVSGSTGLIGQALCKRLRANGHVVRTMQRQSSGQNESSSAASVAQPTSSEQIQWDPAHGLLDPQQLNGVDCVFHLAGRSIAAARWTAAEKKRIRNSRVQATQRLVEQLCKLASPPKTFISASAIGIYGDRGDQLVDESTPAADSFLADVVSDWEAACLPLVEAGVRVVHPRLGMVLSPAGGGLSQMLPIFRWRLAGRLGSGKQYWSWIALPDVISALEWMMCEPSAAGSYNVVAEAITNAEFTKTLADALGVSALVPAPAWGMRLALGEMADALLLCSCRVVPQRLTAAGFTMQHPELAPFLADGITGTPAGLPIA